MTEHHTVRCPHCAHIHWSDDVHQCPDPDYLAWRDALVSAAAEADENRPCDEQGHPIER